MIDMQKLQDFKALYRAFLYFRGDPVTLTYDEARKTFPKTIEAKHPNYICKKTFTLHDVVFAVAEHKNRIVKNLDRDGFYTKVVTKSKNFPVTAYAIYKCTKD